MPNAQCLWWGNHNRGKSLQLQLISCDKSFYWRHAVTNISDALKLNLAPTLGPLPVPRYNSKWLYIAWFMFQRTVTYATDFRHSTMPSGSFSGCSCWMETIAQLILNVNYEHILRKEWIESRRKSASKRKHWGHLAVLTINEQSIGLSTQTNSVTFEVCSA